MEEQNGALARAIEKYTELCEGPANWQHWGALVTVCDWEAVWLSLGLDPKEAGDAHAKMQVGTEHRDDFAARMFFGERRDVIESYFNIVENERAARFRAVRNWSETDAISSSIYDSFDPTMGRPEVREVRLQEFAARCILVGWQIPDSLRALAKSTPASPGYVVADGSSPKEISPRAEKTYLNIIGGLLDLLLGKTPSGQPISKYESQSAVIEALEARHNGKYGLKKRTLEEKFAEAKNSLSQD